MECPVRAQITGKQEKKVMLVGGVRNNFTGFGEGDARVSVYKEDGTELEPRLFLLTYAGRPRRDNEFRVLLPEGKYRFHVECTGYKPFDYWYEIKNIRRKEVIVLPDFLIQRDFSEKEGKDVELGEAVVRATKVKMYYKGDTLVYNASAFRLPDGSMLDELLRQLPGVKMEKNGDIYINGRKLDFLLLNGKEFFGKDNKVMLENLPYYVVEALKVYEQESTRSQALGHEVDAKLYVMDVRLKKEYAIGYMGNAEGAGGTCNRYLARLFGLRFTDYSRWVVFGGVNNLNESRRPGADTNWSPSDNTAGTERRHSAGMSLLCENQDESWKEEGDAIATWTRTDNRERSFSEKFLADGNTFNKSSATGIVRNFGLVANNNFTLKKPFFFKSKTTFRYQRDHHRGEDSFAAFNAYPDSPDADTLNCTEKARKDKGKNLEVAQSAQFLRNIYNGDDVELNAGFNYSRYEEDEFSLYELRYSGSTGQDDWRHRFNDNFSKGYAYSASFLYRFNFSQGLKWELTYGYEQSDNVEGHQRYRLDRIDGWEQQSPAIDQLPSNRELLRLCIDNENAYTSHLQGKTHKLGTRWTVCLGKYTQFNVGFNAHGQDKRLRQASAPIDTTIRRKGWLYSLDVEYNYQSKKYRNRLYAHANQSAPSMERLIPVANTYNPLAITLGNPNLENMCYYGLYNDFSISFGKGKLVSLDNHAGWRYYQNQMATATSYERMTGVYTYRPECVNGNYRLFLANDLGFRFRRAKRLTVNNSLGYDYIHNVDLYLPENAECSIRSKVVTHKLSESVKINYDFGKVQMGLAGKVEYHGATSPRHDFKNVHAFDLACGVDLRYEMPWKFHLSSDFKVYSHKGYGSAEMNSDDFVWNLALSRSVLKGKLNIKLQGFDILHNLNNVTCLINGQGRTETWRKSLPSYWMLHLQWKFNKSPQKK